MRVILKRLLNNIRILIPQVYVYLSISKHKNMPQIIINYKNLKTLEALQDFAKYFDFSIQNIEKSTPQKTSLNGVSIIKGDKTIDLSEMSKIFTGKNINAKELRQKGWERNK